MCKFTIPLPFHICVDDVGWFCGRDDRAIGGPSRTAMPRYHVPEDYEVLQMLGDEVGMNISCAFILGEWDMENRLSSIPNLSHFEGNWKNSIYRDKKEMERIVDIINSSPKLDMALHGLYHGYYAKGVDNPDLSDYYYTVNGRLHMTAEDEIRQRFDSFFDIMEYHNIKKSINHFIPPSFAFAQGGFTHILKEYGISYVSTIFSHLTWETGSEKNAFVENGVAVVDRNNNQIPWDSVGFDASTLEPCRGILGLHWPNLLHLSPADNRDSVKRIAEYVKRCLEEFSVAVSEDISLCATQYLYEKYTDVKQNEMSVELDISKVPRSECVKSFFFVNTKTPIVKIDGAHFTRHKKLKSHITYKVVPQQNNIRISLS